MSDDLSNGAQNVSGKIGEWVKQPFNASMDLTHWFLFTGLLIVISIAWMMILHELRGE